MVLLGAASALSANLPNLEEKGKLRTGPAIAGLLLSPPRVGLKIAQNL
jgi:hypothetical protein